MRSYLWKSNLIVSLALLLTFFSYANDVDISKHGAIADGKTVNTLAIQNAIDECSRSGGGKVFIQAGKWLSGTIILKDNVTLSLDKDAVLSGSTNISDYYIVDGFTDGTGQKMGYCFVGAIDATNVGIEGKGTIDGQGKAVLAANGRSKRPFLVRFVRSRKVAVKDVRLMSSTAWTMHFFRCEKVRVTGISIFSRGLSNNDGIDIDCCNEVVINDCDITSDDDAICFKTTSPFPCENIVVKNIRIRTNCAAVKFGTESTGDFKNIKVSDIRVTYAGLGILKILSVDGAQISDIDISNIVADTVNLPILLRLGARLKTFRPDDIKKGVGSISNIKIKSITVKRAAVAGLLISGIPGHSISGVTIEGIKMNILGGGTAEDVKVRLPENESAYPEIRMFGKVIPAYGMYIRHANNINIKDVVITSINEDARASIYAEDVNTLIIDKWEVPVISTTETLINFNSVQEAVIRSFKSIRKPKVFLNVEGINSNNIIIEKRNSTENVSAVNLQPGLDPKTVMIIGRY